MPLGNPMGYMTGMGGFDPMMLQKLMGQGSGLGSPMAGANTSMMQPNPMQNTGFSGLNSGSLGALGGGGIMNQGVQQGFSKMPAPQMQPAMQQNQNGPRRPGGIGGIGGGRMY